MDPLCLSLVDPYLLFLMRIHYIGYYIGGVELELESDTETDTESGYD